MLCEKESKEILGSENGKHKDLESWKGMEGLGKKVVMQGRFTGNAEVGWKLVWVQSIKEPVLQAYEFRFCPSATRALAYFKKKK